MNLLKLSCLFILLVLDLVLNVSILSANGIQKDQETSPRAQSTKPLIQKPLAVAKAPNIDQRGTKDNPLIVDVINPEKIRAESTNEQKEREEKLALDRKTVALNEQTVGLNSEVARFTGYLAILAFVQCLMLAAQLYFNYKQTENQRVIERAYVKMSHDLPGMMFSEEDQDSVLRICWVEMKIKNFGKTPARVTDVVMEIIPTEQSAKLPDPLDDVASRGKPFSAFLLENEEVFHTQPKYLDPDVMLSVRAGTKKLFVYGYIDYIDQFGVRHRAGYGRAYVYGRDFPGAYPAGTSSFEKRDNLDLLTEPGYNYDRPRKKVEGGDWQGSI